MAYESILVVDDSPTQLSLITNALRGQGYRVTTATDGEEALVKAASEQPDLIVLDIIMPKPNGFQVCRKLKRQDATKDIKILFLSSKDQDSDKIWGMRQGADAYLTKPFVDGELVDVVSSLCRREA